MSISGIMFLGIGDLFSGLIGSKFGNKRIFLNKRKTYLGLFSGFFTMLIGYLIVYYILD